MFKRILYIGILPLFLIACKGGGSYESAATDSVAPYSDAAAPVMTDEASASESAKKSEIIGNSQKPALPKNRKFVRTAQMSFEVKNVEDATQRVETMVAQRKGYVTKSELRSSLNDSKNIELSSDSIEQVASYSISTAMTIRVPNDLLDSLLIDIASVSTFLNYRIVRADDVTVQYFASSQKNKNLQTAQQKLDAAAKAPKHQLDDVVESTEHSLDWANQAVDQQAVTMTLDDQVSYSTVELDFSQHLIIKKSHVPNHSLDDYTPSFGHEFVKSLQTSFFIFKQIILFFVKIWPILALIAGLIWFITWLQRRKKNKQ